MNLGNVIFTFIKDTFLTILNPLNIAEYANIPMMHSEVQAFWYKVIRNDTICLSMDPLLEESSSFSVF